MALAVLLVSLVSAARAGDPMTFQVGEFSFTAPAGWESMPPPSPMRKAMFKVPGISGGRDGLVIFYHFGRGRGGSAEANIARWKRQFKEPPDEIEAKVATKDVGANRLHAFVASGTYLSGAPGGAKTEVPDYSLMAAVIESDRGNVFIRFVAPTELAQASAADFQALIESPFR